MIQARQLTRDFVVKKEVVHAVRGIDLDVAAGELVALLGPNGAGKSTTLRMLTTLIPPTSGSAVVAGCDVATDAPGVRRRIGYIGQGNGAGRSWRVRDELVMQGRFYAMPKREAADRADELLHSLELADLAKRKVSSLSGGQRRRLDVAMGLMHRPVLLFLDEPSTGMDPQNRANLWDHVLRLRDAGTTIVLTTHYLEEADSFAERVIVIDHGRIIADDTAAALKSTVVGDLLTVRVPEAQASAAGEIVRRHGRDIAASRQPGGVQWTLHTDQGRAAFPALIAELALAGCVPDLAELREPTLDDVFLRLTGRSLREEGAVPQRSASPAGSEPVPTGADR